MKLIFIVNYKIPPARDDHQGVYVFGGGGGGGGGLGGRGLNKIVNK